MWVSRVLSALALIAAVFAADPVSAGMVRFVVSPNTEDIAKLIVSSERIELAPRTGELQTLAIADDALVGRLTVELQTNAPQAIPFKLAYNLPFSFNLQSADTPPFEINVTIARGGRLVDLRQSLIRNGGTRLSGSWTTRMDLFQTARVIVGDVLTRGDVVRLTNEDFRLALMFLKVARDLVTTRYVEPDADMENVSSFLSDHLELSENLAERAEAEAVIEQVRQARHHQLLRVMELIDTGLASDEPATRKVACDKAERMNRFVGDLALDPERQSELDPTHIVEVRAVRNLIACVSPSLAIQNVKPTVSAAVRSERALALAARLKRALEAYQESPSPSEYLVRQSLAQIDRLNEMAETLDRRSRNSKV